MPFCLYLPLLANPRKLALKITIPCIDGSDDFLELEKFPLAVNSINTLLQERLATRRMH